MAFPGGLTTIQVTGTSLLALDGTPLNGVIILTPSSEITKPAIDLLLEGSATGEVINGVMTPITIPTTDSVTPTFTYTISQRLQTVDGAASDPAPVEGVSIPASLGASVDISSLI